MCFLFIDNGSVSCLYGFNTTTGYNLQTVYNEDTATGAVKFVCFVCIVYVHLFSAQWFLALMVLNAVL